MEPLLSGQLSGQLLKNPLFSKTVFNFLLTLQKTERRFPDFIEPRSPQTKQLFSKKRSELNIIRAKLEDKNITLFFLFYSFILTHNKTVLKQLKMQTTKIERQIDFYD